jgi:hypothetical protein
VAEGSATDGFAVIACSVGLAHAVIPMTASAAMQHNIHASCPAARRNAKIMAFIPMRSHATMSVTRTLAALLLASAGAGAALAQSPAPAAADTSQCAKPDPHPGRLASNEKLKGWNKEVNVWQECMKKHIAEIQAKADAAVKVANSAVADSNAAVSAYNATVKELQAQADANTK